MASHLYQTLSYCRFPYLFIVPVRYVSYVQGQSPEKNIREYFYYIDHQGMLFLDDARMKNFTSCFKEKKFLAFFFKRLGLNNSGRYADEFPYLSPCGPERNFVRCDDRPIVYSQLITKKQKDGTEKEMFSYNHAGDLLMVDFNPEKLCMLPQTGRVYYPCGAKTGEIGLVRSTLAIEFSKFFQFDNSEANPPTHITWKGKKYVLTNELLAKVKGMVVNKKN